MEQLLNLASRLGKLIAEHERFKKLRAAENAVNADAETRGLVEALEAQRNKIADLEAKLQPVEPEDKHELQRLTDAVHVNPKLQALAEAQADYFELMNKIDREIRSRLGVPEAPDPAPRGTS